MYVSVEVWWASSTGAESYLGVFGSGEGCEECSWLSESAECEACGVLGGKRYDDS